MDGYRKMQYFSLFVLCFSAERGAKRCHKGLGYVIKKPACGAPCAFKARLIDKTHD